MSREARIEKLKNGTAHADRKRICTGGLPARHSDFLRRCGETINGTCEIGCGRFLPSWNWMLKGGEDGRGGNIGNAPLCSSCCEGA